MVFQDFAALVAKYAKVESATADDLLFSGPISISSIAYTELVLEIEERCDLDLDLDALDAETTTVGQLHAFIFPQ